MRVIIGIIYGLFFLNTYVSFKLKSEGIGRILKKTVNFMIGVTIYAALTIFTALIIRLIVKYIRKRKGKSDFNKRTLQIVGSICFALTVGFCVYGSIHARDIKINNYEISVDKNGGKIKDLNIVLIADLHLGLNVGCSQIEQMVEKINSQKPDVVVIAGDIFDNNFDNLDDPESLIALFKKIETKYGMYSVYGNHDIEEPILCGFTFSSDKKKIADIRMDKFLEDCGIVNLRDEGIMVNDSFYLYGRPDYERLGAGIEARKSANEISSEVDSTVPIVVIDHEPRELQELSAAGVDIDLSGHTHDGQLFPLNIPCKLVWENCAGYLAKGNMHSIVTSGVGVYGPFMRVGTDAEIAQITVHFNN